MAVLAHYLTATARLLTDNGGIKPSWLLVSSRGKTFSFQPRVSSQPQAQSPGMNNSQDKRNRLALEADPESRRAVERGALKTVKPTHYRV